VIHVVETASRASAVGGGRNGSRFAGDRTGNVTARAVSRDRQSTIAGDSPEQDEVISDDERTFVIRADHDVPVARQYARAFAERTGFTNGDQIIIDAVIGELATNILTFAGKGEFVFATKNDDGRTGIVIVARDEGPGIPDVSRAFTDGYSTSGRLGLGLAGARRLMDSFDVASAPGKGTTITMKKWRGSRA
jgi:serine/threonine-protein kinase RsbT